MYYWTMKHVDISSFGENLDQCYNFLNFFQNSVHKVAILTFRSPGVAKSFEAPSHHERKILELLAGFKKLKMLLYRTLRPDQFFGDGTSSTLPIFTNLQYLSLFARSVHGRQIDFVSNLVNTFSLAVEGGFFPSLRGFACWGWEEKRFPAYREWFRNRNIKLTAVSRKRVRSQWDDWEKLVESQF
ncbi:hypothetical protein BT69DRAFT_1321050 [Atractiella rhizophila]|nr:hypothetical protein BT69DRAFT_1321050 [Atractiella rhizophila]